MQGEKNQAQGGKKKKRKCNQGVMASRSQRAEVLKKGGSENTCNRIRFVVGGGGGGQRGVKKSKTAIEGYNKD